MSKNSKIGIIGNGQHRCMKTLAQAISEASSKIDLDHVQLENFTPIESSDDPVDDPVFEVFPMPEKGPDPIIVINMEDLHE